MPFRVGSWGGGLSAMTIPGGIPGIFVRLIAICEEKLLFSVVALGCALIACDLGLSAIGVILLELETV